jgi:hypothetical protein
MRCYHTTVIDAAGAMYLIGGSNGGATLYNDVWSSADKGANRTQGGYYRGYSKGNLKGTEGVRTGY